MKDTNDKKGPREIKLTAIVNTIELRQVELVESSGVSS